jgi:membrane carboxypeptidase/penicillin-binding protein
MREDGYIDEEIEASVSGSLEEVEFKRGLVGIKAPHFSLYVKQLLEDMYGENLVEKGGLKVTTTLDYELHEAAQDIVSEEIEKVEAQGIGNGAAMVMDPQTGEIWSMVGSKDFFAEDYDGQVNVTESLRQPGSSIKPVTYATAFAKGYTPAYTVMDVKTEFPSGDGKVYIPENYDGSYRGPIQLRFALGSSLNVPAVKMLALVGVEDMLKTAHEMGFSTLEPTQENLARFGLAVTLGGGEVRLIDMVSAYSAFANGGLKTEPVAILKVEDRDGKVLYEHKPVNGKRVIGEEVAFLINHILSDNNARLLTFGANSYLNMGGRAVAVKTGTTNDKRDNWTVGWSETGMVGVWVGNNDNSPMKQVASGVTGASPIWRRIMLEVLDKHPADFWEIPGTVEAVLVDTVSGYPEHDGYAARSEYIIKGTLPALPDPIHTKLKLCRGQDKLASDVDIEKHEYDEKEFYVFTEDVTLSGVPSWQEGIDAWIASQGDEKYHVPKEYCDTADEVVVRVEAPEDKQEFSDNEVAVRVRVITQGELDRVEIWVDGARRESLVTRPYETKLTLVTGRHSVKVIAIRRDGKRGESGEVRIGVGGESWEEAEPTPTPSPTLKPVPSKTPKPTAIELPDDT